MTHDVPMLADFGVRLAFGLALLLLSTSWRVVPLPFFRTHCLVILGLLILGVLDTSRADGLRGPAWLLIWAAILTYAAAVSWGLGLPRLAVPATAVIALTTFGWLVWASRSDAAGIWFFNSASRCASGFLLGAALTAMLMGHHYLIAPSLSIDPLKRFVRFMGWGFGARGLIALVGLYLAHSGLGGGHVSPVEAGSSLFPLMRWGIGFLAPLAATIMAWKTVQIRSTQSATGILYAAMTLVLVGELTSLIGSRAGGFIG